MTKKYTPEEQIITFWNKVNKDGSIPAHYPELGNCWEWTANLNHKGYGQKSWFGRMTPSHRISWMLSNGNIPDGLWVLHKCDNRKCVNPDHLFLGTHQDNMDDMMIKGRRADRRGENHPNVRITDLQVIDIRECYAKGNVSQRELAKKYNVWPQQISRIVRQVQRK